MEEDDVEGAPHLRQAVRDAIELGGRDVVAGAQGEDDRQGAELVTHGPGGVDPREQPGEPPRPLFVAGADRPVQPGLQRDGGDDEEEIEAEGDEAGAARREPPGEGGGEDDEGDDRPAGARVRQAQPPQVEGVAEQADRGDDQQREGEGVDRHAQRQGSRGGAARVGAGSDRGGERASSAVGRACRSRRRSRSQSERVRRRRGRRVAGQTGAG
ncbi:hypothetical protein [Nannocystis pusilla]|uniref:hypothetical protein n=1 Tax=Nannocystis pusilla TaxID=889268 RepID=UPI003DA1D0D7